MLIEQTVKKHEGRLQLIVLLGLSLPGGPLSLAPGPIHGTIQIAPRQFPALEPVLLHQSAQGVFDRHMHDRLQFIGKVTGRGVGHQRGRCVQQAPVSREVNVTPGP